MMDATELESSQIIQRVRALHGRVVRGAIEATLCGALIGLDLGPIRDVLPPGAWTHFVETQCEFSARSAGNYVTAAANATAVLSAQLGYTAAPEQVRAALENALIANDEAMAEACRRGLPPPPVPPKKQRAPRPPAPPEKIGQRYADRIIALPEPARDVVFAALAEHVLAWAERHSPSSTPSPVETAPAS